MLKRLKLHQFRYIKPGTELMFTEHFNVLLGRNGTGKTTLLDLLSMVLRSDFSALREEAFDIEYEFSHEHGTGVVRFENTLEDPSFTSSTNRSSATRRSVPRHHHPHVFIRLQLDRIAKGHEVEVEVDGAVVRWRKGGDSWEDRGIVEVFDGSFLEALSGVFPFRDDVSREVHVLLGGFSQNGLWAYRFDESLAVFESITAGDAGRMLKPGRAPAIELEMRFEAGPGPLHDLGASRSRFFPHQYEPECPEPGQSSTSVPLELHLSLAKFSDLAGLKKMTMSLAIEKSWREPDGLWWRFGRAEFFFSGVGDVKFSHDFLSYGQKRLLAFLYYLDANSHFVIADELVNGMHHDWIRACLDEIGDRQAFLTSQNPLLLDYLPLESVEQVQKSFIQCRSEIIGDATQLVWANLAAEDAQELFADYQVGIQQVGEILRARGLW